jgi:hypothetical protein
MDCRHPPAAGVTYSTLTHRAKNNAFLSISLKQLLSIPINPDRYLGEAWRLLDFLLPVCYLPSFENVKVF